MPGKRNQKKMMIKQKINKMKRILLFLTSLSFLACVNTTTQEQKESTEEHENASASASELQLNNGAKWKADSITLVNVSAVNQLVSDSNYRDEKNRVEFSGQLQSRLDTLVKQCKMTGPDHDALHAWLKSVLHDVKELKEDGDKYDKKYAELQKDVQNFYDYFE
jgi:hypothetical protein